MVRILIVGSNMYSERVDYLRLPCNFIQYI